MNLKQKQQNEQILIMINSNTKKTLVIESRMQLKSKKIADTRGGRGLMEIQ